VTPIIELINDAAYWTSAYGVWRHDGVMCKPGRYAVVCSRVTLALARMQGVEKPHVACVVDDFGDLVAVPA
jgi:hypothetical protein